MLRIFCFLAAAVTAGPTAAQVPCTTRDTVAKALTEGYGEVPVLRGVTTGGLLVELWASAERTWTLVVTRPDGSACVPLTGDGYEPLPQMPAGKAS